MTPEEFRHHGHQLIDRIADYRAKIATRPVQSTAFPGSIRAQLPATPPADPESFDKIFDDLDQVILPGLTHWQHPNFFGYFPGNSELSAWRGVIQDTASSSTLVALLCARERSSEFSLTRGGLQGEDAPLVVYYSAQAHSSVEKAALLAGFGRANLRPIATDAAHALDPEALATAIAADRANGLRPCAIVATTGTTTSTAIDPIAALARIATAQGLWLHVDAAMAGSAMILPECRWMWDGIEGADSIVLNAHKWLGVPFDCSLYYVRDAEHLIRVMSTNPSYLRSAVDDRVQNLRDWGIPLGRRFRALKLWCLIREQGVAGLAARLRRDLANAQWLATQVAAEPYWRVLAPVHLQTVCVRHEPPGLQGENLDHYTQAWAEGLNRSGAAYVTPAVLDGRWMVRISIGSLLTEREHVEALWARLRGRG
jgi:aromatic-L-amino-acid decarboxylase